MSSESMDPEPEVAEPWKKRLRRLLLLKPVMLFFCLSFSVTGSIRTQLTIDRTCSVNLALEEHICANLTSPENEEYENQVQQMVSHLNIINSYLEEVPAILTSLYLGPWSDVKRKPLMYLPFMGGIYSAVFHLCFVHFTTWPAQALWASSVSAFFGGFSLLQITMYGYVRDITTDRERTVVMSVLAGLSIVVIPVGELASGYLYAAGGFYAVYGTSTLALVLGLIYLFFVPESVTKAQVDKDQHSDEQQETGHQLPGCLASLSNMVVSGNRMMILAVRTLLKRRPEGKRSLILALCGVILIDSLGQLGSDSPVLFLQKVFGWSIVDCTNYFSFLIGIYMLRTFLTTPILSYWLKMHDLMLAVSGIVVAIAFNLTVALSTKAWMMFFAAAITIVGGIPNMALKSMLSKSVEADEFGKIFTVCSVCSSLGWLVMSSIKQYVYAVTVASHPEFFFYLSAALNSLTLISVGLLGLFLIYHKRRFGRSS